MDVVVSGDGAYQCTIVIHIDAHFSTRRVGRSPRVFFLRCRSDLLRFPRLLLRWLFEEQNDAKRSEQTFWRQISFFTYAVTWLAEASVMV